MKSISAMRVLTECPIEEVQVYSYTIPTEQPESDGTYEWDHSTVILVEIVAANHRGLGMTYGAKSVGHLIEEKFKSELLEKEALDIPSLWLKMNSAVRNIGRPGIASMAISAVDLALWDLKAKILGLPLYRLLGAMREGAPVYGSGGFTSYSIHQLQSQLLGWEHSGIPRVKMKMGRNPDQDLDRVRAVREAIEPKTELFVDANGAYERGQALYFARSFAEMNVSWFEEPVSSDDLEGLRYLREKSPIGIEIAAGEYGFNSEYFSKMILREAVDVIQIDVTRCCGITGFLKILDLAEAFHYPVSTHCAPSMHIALGCHSKSIRHMEYFHDHVRIEKLLFEGVVDPQNGCLKPDPTQLGMGLVLKKQEASRFAA